MHISRRSVVAAGVAAPVVPALVACGNPGEDVMLNKPEPAAAGEVLAKAEQVPVGGCYVNAKAAVVVTQPTEGDFRAFSGVCTHKHCFLASFPKDHIPCRCHGSKFDLNDGSVLEGPAVDALEQYEIKVEGSTITMA